MPSPPRLPPLRAAPWRWSRVRLATARRLWRESPALRRCCRRSEVRRGRARHRAQRKQALGPLALGVPDVSPPDVRRRGGELNRPFLLGARFLREPPREGLLPQRHTSSARVQVDADPVSLLGGSHPIRRIPLPLRPPEAPIAAAQVRRRPDFIICLRSASGRGMGSLPAMDNRT